MTRHAVINNENTVVNVVIFTGDSWTPPENHFIVESNKADIGDIYDKENNEFIKKIGA
jgi:hypothetical protein